VIISARLTDGMRPGRLKLDSGTSVPFLYNTSDYMALRMYRGVVLGGGGASGAQRTFGPGQAAQVAMNHDAVETLINKGRQIAKQTSELFHAWAIHSA
jgi:hypothetical protein